MTRSLLLAVILALSTSAGFALDYKLGALEIKQPWARATPKGAAVAGGYVRITNTGTTPDRLTGGSLTAAGRIEIHEMATVDGVMKMRPLPTGIEIKPGETVELKPGSFHMMFMDLKQPLTQGQPIKGTLVFEKAGTIEIEYAVAPIGAPGPSGGHGGGHKGGH
jgi:copper(I)-binding protein